MFRGLNKISLDTKGRISIPTKYRSELAKSGSDKLICTIDIDQCLLLYPKKDLAQDRKNNNGITLTG